MTTIPLQLDRPLKAVSLSNVEFAPKEQDRAEFSNGEQHSSSLENEPAGEFDSAEPERNVLLKNINEAITSYQSEQSRRNDEFRTSLIQLAVRIAKCIVVGELRQSSEQLANLIEEQIKQFEVGIAIDIRVNPLDAKRLNESSVSFSGSATISSDAAIAVGNCQLKVADSTLAHSYSRQLDAFEKRLIEVMSDA